MSGFTFSFMETLNQLENLSVGLKSLHRIQNLILKGPDNVGFWLAIGHLGHHRLPIWCHYSTNRPARTRNRTMSFTTFLF